MINLRFVELWEMAEHDLHKTINENNEFFKKWNLEKTDDRQRYAIREFVRTFGDVVQMYDGDIKKAEKDMLDYFDYCYNRE